MATKKPAVVYTAPSYGGEAGTRYYEFPSAPDYSSIDAMKRDADEKATQAWLSLIGGGINTIFDTKSERERIQTETEKLQNEAAKQKLDQQKSIIEQAQKYLNPEDGSPRATGDELLSSIEDIFAKTGDVAGLVSIENARQARQDRAAQLQLQQDRLDETLRSHDMMDTYRQAALDKRGSGEQKPSFSYFTDPATGDPVMIDKNNPADRAKVTQLRLVPGKQKQQSESDRLLAEAVKGSLPGAATKDQPAGPGIIDSVYNWLGGSSSAPAPETKIFGGQKYQKVPGGWAKVK